MPLVELRDQIISVLYLPGAPAGCAEVRPRLIDRLRKDPRLARITHLFDIRPGGPGTIDFAVAKGIALANYIASEKTEPDRVYYFGDEFYVEKIGDDELLGNDMSIRHPATRDIHLQAVNKTEDPHQLFPVSLTLGEGYSALWIGSGYPATHNALIQLAHALRQNENPPPTPAPGAYGRGDYRRQMMHIWVGPLRWNEDLRAMAQLILDDAFVLLADDALFPGYFQDIFKTPDRLSPEELVEALLLWLDDIPGPFDGPLGWVISAALEYKWGATSREMEARDSESAMSTLVELLRDMDPQGSFIKVNGMKSLGQLLSGPLDPHESFADPSSPVAVVFAGKEHSVQLEFALVDHAEAYGSPDDFIGIVELTQELTPGLRLLGRKGYYKLYVERHLLDRGGKEELKRAIDHALREVILRSLKGYPTDPAHSKALEDAAHGVPLEDYYYFPPYEPVRAQRHSSSPGADHRDSPPRLSSVPAAMSEPAGPPQAPAAEPAPSTQPAAVQSPQVSAAAAPRT